MEEKDFTCEDESEEGKRRLWSIGGRAGGEDEEGAVAVVEGPGGGKGG